MLSMHNLGEPHVVLPAMPHCSCMFLLCESLLMSYCCTKCALVAWTARSIGESNAYLSCNQANKIWKLLNLSHRESALLVFNGEHLLPAERPYSWLGSFRPSEAVAGLIVKLGDDITAAALGRLHTLQVPMPLSTPLKLSIDRKLRPQQPGPCNDRLQTRKSWFANS